MAKSPVIGQRITSASGNTQGVVLEVNKVVTKSGKDIYRVLVQTDVSEQWITVS